MQSSNLVLCNGESACFVVALSGYRRRWVEGEGEWWEEIVRQLACLLLHLGREEEGSRADAWMNERTLQRNKDDRLSSVHTFFFCVVPLWPQVVLQSQTVFPLLPRCRSATQHQPTLQHHLCCYGNCNTLFFPRRNDTTKTNQLETFDVYDRLCHSTHWFVFSFLTGNMKRAHWW